MNPSYNDIISHPIVIAIRDGYLKGDVRDAEDSAYYCGYRDGCFLGKRLGDGLVGGGPGQYHNASYQMGFLDSRGDNLFDLVYPDEL